MPEFVEEWCRLIVETADEYTGSYMWYLAILHLEIINVRWIHRLALFRGPVL
jgi:hypothetical protein